MEKQNSFDRDSRVPPSFRSKPEAPQIDSARLPLRR